MATLKKRGEYLHLVCDCGTFVHDIGRGDDGKPEVRSYQVTAGKKKPDVPATPPAPAPDEKPRRSKSVLDSFFEDDDDDEKDGD